MCKSEKVKAVWWEDADFCAEYEDGKVIRLKEAQIIDHNVQVVQDKDDPSVMVCSVQLFFYCNNDDGPENTRVEIALPSRGSS